MAGEPVVTPPLNAPATILVDWLELIAFFNEFGIARLDVLQGALAEQGYLEKPDDEHEDDIGERDKKIDKLIEKIENEITERETACNGGYPFELSDDAEELSLKTGWGSEEHRVYFVCLLTSHLTKKSLFDFEVKPALLTRLRNRVFQVISTIAMAGLANGSAASIGWPRPNNETVIEALKRAQARGSGFDARDVVGPDTPRQEKDGGIDIISWSVDDRVPPSILYYGQVASGHDWKGKPVTTYVKSFEAHYFDVGPRGNTAFATLIPFRETDVVLWRNQHMQHGTLLDRTRVPRFARVGFELSNAGQEMDEVDNLPQVTQWIADFRKCALDTAA